MSNYYDLLGVDARATDNEIKTAFRQRAKELHPDANPGGAKDLQGQFQQVAEAYEVLRDTARRAQYDAARSASAFSGSAPGFSGDAYQSGVSEDAFEAAFRRWWEKAGSDWQRQAVNEDRQRKSSAEIRMEQAAAWAEEKAAAKLNKARFERVKQRTRQARAARQAQTLRTAWQTHGGVSWVDVAVAASATAVAAVVLGLWKPLLSDSPLEPVAAEEADKG